jgi:hypothetical protein
VEGSVFAVENYFECLFIATYFNLRYKIVFCEKYSTVVCERSHCLPNIPSISTSVRKTYGVKQALFQLMWCEVHKLPDLTKTKYFRLDH